MTADTLALLDRLDATEAASMMDALRDLDPATLRRLVALARLGAEVPFLRSVIACGERLNEEDNERLDAAALRVKLEGRG